MFVAARCCPPPAGAVLDRGDFHGPLHHRQPQGACVCAPGWLAHAAAVLPLTAAGLSRAASSRPMACTSAAAANTAVCLPQLVSHNLACSSNTHVCTLRPPQCAALLGGRGGGLLHRAPRLLHHAPALDHQAPRVRVLVRCWQRGGAGALGLSRSVSRAAAVPAACHCWRRLRLAAAGSRRLPTCTAAAGCLPMRRALLLLRRAGPPAARRPHRPLEGEAGEELELAAVDLEQGGSPDSDSKLDVSGGASWALPAAGPPPGAAVPAAAAAGACLGRWPDGRALLLLLPPPPPPPLRA